MTEMPPDDPASPVRPRFTRSRQSRAQGAGQRLLAQGLRTLDGKAGAATNRVLRIARGQFAPSPKAALRRAIAVAVRGRPLAPRHARGAGVRAAGPHAQRVIVKARVVPLRSKVPAQAIGKHLAYMARDAAARDGATGRLFDSASELDRAAIDAFTERALSCRHQFRFIVSPERGGDLDLPAFTRDLVRAVERDLGTRLDYAAAVHYDTDQPHVHLVVNGRDARGGDLVISRDYIGQGLRHRAMELATDALGYRSQLDILQSLSRDLRADRFTALDRRLQTLAERHPNGVIDLHVTPTDARSALQRRLYLGRLAHLTDTGLAREVANGVWRLEPDALDRLRGVTQHQEIQRRVEKHLDPADRAGTVEVIDKAALTVPITGRVLGRGHANELSGMEYLVVSGTDGKTYYLALSPHAERHLDHAGRVGDLVTLKRVEPRGSGRADRVIVELAGRNGGVYDAGIHRGELGDRRLPHDATPERFVEAHVRRLDALVSRGFVTREGEGRYRIPSDLIDRLAHDPAIARDGAFVQVDVRGRDLRAEAAARAYTWIDEQLVAGVPQQVRQAAMRTRFQNELIDAADQRAKRLVQLGLGRLHGDRLTLDPNLKPKLDRIERDAAAERLGQTHGRFVDTYETRHFRGRVASIEELASGPHAVVVADGRFTLVPAERGVANAIGKDVSLSLDRSPTSDAEQTRVRFRMLDALDISPSLGR